MYVWHHDAPLTLPRAVFLEKFPADIGFAARAESPSSAWRGLHTRRAGDYIEKLQGRRTDLHKLTESALLIAGGVFFGLLIAHFVYQSIDWQAVAAIASGAAAAATAATIFAIYRTNAAMITAMRASEVAQERRTVLHSIVPTLRRLQAYRVWLENFGINLSNEPLTRGPDMLIFDWLDRCQRDWPRAKADDLAATARYFDPDAFESYLNANNAMESVISGAEKFQRQMMTTPPGSPPSILLKLRAELVTNISSAIPHLDRFGAALIEAVKKYT